MGGLPSLESYTRPPLSSYVVGNRPPLSAYLSPDFSDVTGGASSTADDLLRKKRREIADAWKAAAGGQNEGLGRVPQPDTSLSAVATEAAGLTGATAANANVGLANMGRIPLVLTEQAIHRAAAPFQEAAQTTADTEQAARLDAARRLLAAGGLPPSPLNATGLPSPLGRDVLRMAPRSAVPDPLGGVQEMTQHGQDEAAGRLAAASGDLPAGVSVPIFWGATTAGLMADAGLYVGGGVAEPFGTGPGALRAAAARQAAAPAAGMTPEEAAYLARRAASLRAMPSATEAPLRPGAVVDAMQPERSILQVGAHADDLSQDVALGLRARPQDAADAAGLARQSLDIADAAHAAPSRLISQTPRWATTPEEGLAGWPEFAKAHAGKAIDPADLPFALEDLPLTRWESTPGAVNPARGATNWSLGDTEMYRFKEPPANLEGRLASRSAEGGHLPRTASITPQRPLVMIGDSGLSPMNDDAERALLKGYHDAVIKVSPHNPYYADVITHPDASLLDRPSPYVRSLAQGGPRDAAQDFSGSFDRMLPSPGQVSGDLLPSSQESGLQVTRQPADSLGSQLGAVDNVQAGAAPVAEPSAPPPTLRNFLTGEELPLDTPRTGTTHAITRAEQEAAGLPRTVPRPRVDAWEEARQVFEQDPQAARQLAQEVAAKPRPLSDFEEHLLQHDRAQLKPAYDDALAAEEHALASGDPAQAAAAKLHRLAVERDFQANADAADLGGTQWGKSGNARQVEIGEDYSPLQLVRRYKVANLGEDAPDAVRAKLVDVSRQLEAAQTRLAAAEERAQTLEAQRMIHSENQAAAREIRSKGRAAVTAGLDQEYAGLSAEWRKATGLAQAGVNPDQAAILAKMARNRVRAGVTNLQDLVDGIFQDARPHLDTLEPRDVRDAIAGASPKAQAAAKKAAVSEFTALRREARVLNALEDARAKLEAAPDSRARVPLQKEVARWEAEAEKIAGGDRRGGGPLSDPQRIRASLTRNAARQAELRDQIASGTVVSKTRAPVADYPLIQARAETERLRRAADAIIGRRELQNRSWLQKGLDLTAATARFTPLTSVTGTLPKLAAAASWRSLFFRPAEQLLSVADPYLPLIRQLSAEAPVEGGGVGLSALKKSYQGFFSREARAEAMAHLRGDEGPLALSLGKPHQPSGAPAFMDYPSHLHAALKSPAVVAGYNWAMESQAKALARAGQAITPELRATMESNAWDVALRDILLNDNAAVQRFNLALQKLPQDSTATRVGIAAVRSQLPIVKVATNYPLQATDYLFGLPKFGIRAGKVIYRGTKATAGQEARTLADIVHAGIQASPPGYADQIMRNLKRGRLGAALAGLVLTGAVEVGGYYRKGEHRSESDLQPGEIRIGGSDAILQLPHNVLHSSPMEAMQVVGTFKRSKSFSQGLGTSALGLAEQTPFFEESVRLGRDLPNNPAKFAGMAARQISEPPDMQKLARVLDQEKERSTPQKVGQALGWAGLKVGPLEVPEIKARKRTPHGGFWEQLLEQEMLGVPGLRDNVR